MCRRADLGHFNMERFLPNITVSILVIVFSCLWSPVRPQCPAGANCGAGTCVPTGNSYQCTCPPGSTGDSCETNTCDLCQNGAGCSEETFECICATGYTGTHCDEVLHCASTPCQNGGICSEAGGLGAAEFTCSCLPAFTGELCANRIPNCPGDGSAGIEWVETLPGISVTQSCQGVDSALRGKNIVRKCLNEGRWGVLDFSRCTIQPNTSSFLLLWGVVVADSKDQIESRTMEMENEVLELIDVQNEMSVSLTAIVEITSFIYSITFRAEFITSSNSSKPSQSPVLSVLNSLGGLMVIGEGSDYRGFKKSDICSCSPAFEGMAILQDICVVVNRNDDKSPCVCTLDSGCMCAQPFYTGDGQQCAVDLDGDGYPNVPLLSCTSSNPQAYCEKDLCPYMFYPNNSATACEIPDLTHFSGCMRGQDMWGFQWPNAAIGEEAVVKCPDGEELGKRVCGINGWNLPKVLNCRNGGFTSAESEAQSIFQNSEKPLEERLNRSATIAADLLARTAPMDGFSYLPSDLNATNVVVKGIIGLLEDSLSPQSGITHIENQNILDIMNNILDANNADGWITLQEDSGGAESLLDNAERYSLYLARATHNSESKAIKQRDNILIGVSRYQYSSMNDAPVVFPDSSVDTSTFLDPIRATITIPAAVLAERQGGANTVPVTNTIVRGMERLLQANADSPGVSRMVATQVISTQVSERNMGSSDALIENPVTMEFQFDVLENMTDVLCAYWKFSDPVGSGSWAFDGVEMVSMTSSDGTVVVRCQATHLTSFAVLVDVAGSLSGNTTAISGAELQALTAVSYIGCALSLACLLITIIFYISLWRRLLTQVHYFIHLNLAIALFLAYLVFVLGIQLARSSEGGCIFVAALLQYLFLSAFCWMMCEGVMLYLMLVVVFSRLSKKWWFFFLLGWVPALVPVIIGVGARYREYGVENNNKELEYCWLSTEKGVIWAFVAPMLVIIIVNVFFLIVALVRVFQSQQRRGRLDDSKLSVSWDLFKTLFRATAVLLPILGLTWVFGLFAVNRDSTWLAWLFTIFNTLQGVFIFIFHVVLSDKVWKSSQIQNLRKKTLSSVRSSFIGRSFYLSERSGEYSTAQANPMTVKYRNKHVQHQFRSVTETSLVLSSSVQEGEEEEKKEASPAASEMDLKIADHNKIIEDGRCDSEKKVEHDTEEEQISDKDKEHSGDIPVPQLPPVHGIED